MPDTFRLNEKYDSILISPENFNKLQIEYFNKIISFCKKNEIKLILISQPLNPLYYEKNTENKKIHDFFEHIAEKNSISYYNFNTINDTLFKNEDFYDWGHLDQKGAIKFTNFAIQTLNLELSNK